MIRRWKWALWAVILFIPFVLAGVWLSQLDCGIDMRLDEPRGEPLRVVITDPLCGPLRRDDPGSPRRDYTPLGRLLEESLQRRVELSYRADLGQTGPTEQPADLIIGTDPIVAAQAARAMVPARPVVRLSDEHGAMDFCGVFVARADDPARTIDDLDGQKIVFGPPADPERHSLALETLSRHGVAPVPPLTIAQTCRDALQMLTQRQADVAVISSYALALVEDRNRAAPGTFRILGRTPAQPFTTVFATERIGPAAERAITEVLLAVKTQPHLLDALQSQAGFVPLRPEPEPKQDLPAPAPAPVAPWTDWRGPGRMGMSPDVPEKLPATVKLQWKRVLTGAGLSGIAATATHVIVADKSEQKDPGSSTQNSALGSPQDIWRCLDAETGKELWTTAYPTPKQMEFTNVPRATPVIHGNFVYLLGAFGDLYCVSLHGSGIVWRRNIIKDFGAQLPPWGTCATPLVVGDSLIVNPGAADAALVALGLYTGEVIWKTPGAPAAYGSLILGTFGGVRQIVGYDAGSLGGWDPNTGQRLWTLVPEKKGDYNVPTPVNVEGRLLVATENNGTRLYDFDRAGRILPTPIAQTKDLAPDTSTPVVIDGLVFGCARGLVCLDLNQGLKTLYSTDDNGAFKEYAALIAGKGRILAATVRGELVLFQAARDAFTPIDRLRVFDSTEVWSHPALVGNRLYLRSMKEVCCLLLSESP